MLEYKIELTFGNNIDISTKSEESPVLTLSIDCSEELMVEPKNLDDFFYLLYSFKHLLLLLSCQRQARNAENEYE